MDSSSGPGTLQYTVLGEFGDLLTDSCDAALLALLIPAMASGEAIDVAGAVSERLYHNLAGPYQRLLQHVIPSLRRVRLRCANIRSADRRAPGVATGFSAGVDSYCVLADYYYSPVPAGLKLTHLLFNNVGSHGQGGEHVFNTRFAALEPQVERIGLPFVRINSNLDAFYPRQLAFQQTHTPRNVSVALLLQQGIGRFMYASAYSYRDVFIGPTCSMAYSDTAAVPLLSTEVLDACSVGSEYTRVEKTLRVADIPQSWQTLDICVTPDKAR